MRYLLIIGLALAAAPLSWGAPAHTSEGTITLPTYPLHGGDLNPHFYDLEGSIVYPYGMQDDLGDQRVDRTYRAVFLENDYLKIICLPQIGGRIHSVFDKTSNHEMFHRNDAIKPGLIAMRGAWISGGIEWNRGPQGHTITSFSPVDVTSRDNADGSASIIVGYIESNFRTRWDVVLTLHPDKAYLDERISIANPTDGLHSYYFWNNTAFPCKPGTRFIYPMKLGQDHAGTKFFSWPVNNDKDITWLKNYDEPSSVFAYKCAFDFFGAYDVDDDRGIVQYGDHRVITGKKAWTWGQSGDGIASQRALHDDNSQYIEVQSGPLQTQADYGLLGPHQEIAWQEWWYPVHGLGDGFEYATKDLAVQTQWTDDAQGMLEVRLLSTGEYPKAICTIDTHRGAPDAHTIDLSPKNAVVLRSPGFKRDAATIDVRTADGRQLARFDSPLDIPDRTAPTPAAENPQPSVEELYRQGVKHEERIEPGPARAAYEKALAADAAFSPALVALARIDVARGDYAKAAERAQKATERDPGDCMAWYYLTLALMELPKEQRAMEPIDAAYRMIASLDAPGLARDLAGRVRMREGRYTDAVYEFTQAVAHDPDDATANDHLIAALYAAGATREASERAHVRSDAAPLDFIPDVVAALPKTEYLVSVCDHIKQVSGRPEVAASDITRFFVELGLYADAYAFLDTMYASVVPNVGELLYDGRWPDLRDTAGPWYKLAWLAHMSNNDAKVNEYLAKGKSFAPHYQFPTDPKAADVFRFALSVDPADANAHFILGNLFAYQGNLDGAVAEWTKAAETEHPYSVALRNLAVHAWKKENNLPKASGLFAKAIAARPEDQTLYRDAANVLIADQKRPDAIKLLESMPLEHRRRGDVTVLLANSYNDEKRYDDTLALLEKSSFSNWELNTASWQAFNRAHIERGKLRLDAKQNDAALEEFTAALTYPESLGVGRPARPEESEGLYWKGKACAALGRSEDARVAWTQGSQGAEKSDNQKKHIQLCKDALGGAK